MCTRWWAKLENRLWQLGIANEKHILVTKSKLIYMQRSTTRYVKTNNAYITELARMGREKKIQAGKQRPLHPLITITSEPFPMPSQIPQALHDIHSLGLVASSGHHAQVRRRQIDLVNFICLC